MISITCTNCHSVLTIDDAFAGGVCRCQFCGTIQTVPSRSAGGHKKPAVAKALYQKETAPPREEPPPPPQTTGYEYVAEAISSSGLASGLAHRVGTSGADATAAPAVEAAPPPPPAPAPAAPQGTRMSVVAITAAVVVLTGIAVVILLWRVSANRGAAKSSGPVAAVSTGPNFCGLPLNANSVIFLIDRGNSVNELFDTLKAACYKSLKQLGPDRKFQVILWDNDAGSAEFPAGAMRNATAGAIEDCQRNFQDATAGGSTHLTGPLREALDRHPQAIVIATAKIQLDEDDANALRAAADTGSAHISVLQIDAASPNPVLEQAAKSTAGQFKTITGEELRTFSR